MSTNSAVERDERTVAVENASYRLGYFLLYCGLLCDGFYRAIVRHEAPFDLLALVIVSGAVCTLYQAHQKALTHSRVKKMLLIALIWAVLGAILGVVLSLTRG
jgi:hypothetical protein